MMEICKTALALAVAAALCGCRKPQAAGHADEGPLPVAPGFFPVNPPADAINEFQAENVSDLQIENYVRLWVALSVIDRNGQHEVDVAKARGPRAIAAAQTAWDRARANAYERTGINQRQLERFKAAAAAQKPLGERVTRRLHDILERLKRNEPGAREDLGWVPPAGATPSVP